MSQFPKNHESIYFDKLVRSSKMESLLAFIYSAYNAEKKYPDNDVEYKNELTNRVFNAYNLFKITNNPNGAGTYTGSTSQFQSQYTIGHEMCIWYNGSLKLTPLAREVAENKITIRQYLDIIFLNYVQPVNYSNVHILYSILSYINQSGYFSIDKKEITTALGVPCTGDMVNAICHFLEGTDYFTFDDPVLKYNESLPIDGLIARCNINYIGKDGYQKAIDEGLINDEDKYIKYISSINGNKTDDISIIYKNIGGNNIIYYGTPGCGKSYYVNEFYNTMGNKVFRTVFHPEYSNADFVGQILPEPDPKDNKILRYNFHDGIFTTALKYALSNPSINVYLIIEEINRGNASSIFGEIFQLLDRDKIGDSIYSIKNDFIAKSLGKDSSFDIKIPSNLSLVGTMNTSDQNVYSLDTAFKRRWKLVKISNSFKDIDVFDSLSMAEKKEVEYKLRLSKLFIPGSSYTWRTFVERINVKISEKNKGYSIQSEDKELGVYFVSDNYLATNAKNNDKELIKAFGEKVLMYLWNDVVKTNPGKLFKAKAIDGSPINSLDNLLDEFERIPNGDTLNVFTDDIFNTKQDGQSLIEEARVGDPING